MSSSHDFDFFDSIKPSHISNNSRLALAHSPQRDVSLVRETEPDDPEHHFLVEIREEKGTRKEEQIGILKRKNRPRKKALSLTTKKVKKGETREKLFHLIS